MLGTDPELSVLLTLEAIASTPDGQQQPVEVINALGQAIREDRLSRVLDTGYTDSAFVALSPDESVLYVANGSVGGGGIPDALVVQAYSTANDTKLWEHNIEMATTFRDDGILDGDRRLQFLHASPDGTRLSVGIIGTPPRFIILDASTGDESFVGVRPDCPAWVWPMGWSPDGSAFAVYANCAFEDTWVEVLDGNTFEHLTTIGSLPGSDLVASFDDAGHLYLFSGQADTAIYEPPAYTTAVTIQVFVALELLRPMDRL